MIEKVWENEVMLSEREEEQARELTISRHSFICKRLR